jgi:hypothetical protein
MGPRRAAGLSSVVFALAGYVVVGRTRQLSWGATDEECEVLLPGDELIETANLTATRAITIRAAADQVWPWIAQLGQGRGGFYSYDLLENLVRYNIHSADRIAPEWQDVAVGNEVRLAPEVPLLVAASEAGRALVLRGGIRIGKSTAPYDFTWTFALRDQLDETTRLLVRERYAYLRPWAWLLVEPVEAVSFVMSQKMLRGIRDRAESFGSAR